MPEEKKEFQDMFRELMQYEKRGVYIAVGSSPASPMQVVKAHMTKEDSEYMRDYVLNEKGDVKELYFNQVKK